MSRLAITPSPLSPMESELHPRSKFAEVGNRVWLAWISDELANTVTHAVGLLLAVAASVRLVETAQDRGSIHDVVGSAVFGVALMLTFAASTCYHAAKTPHWKQLLRAADYASIYLLIAGTYTAIVLAALPGPWGPALLAVVWVYAVAGIAEILVNADRQRGPLGAYLAMGWLFLLVAKPFFTYVPWTGLLWIALGCGLYLSGLYFFKRDLRMCHAIWHLFVVAGSGCHYVAVMHCIG